MKNVKNINHSPSTKVESAAKFEDALNSAILTFLKAYLRTSGQGYFFLLTSSYITSGNVR